MENLRIETLILRGLRTVEDYSKKVLPFLKESYFVDRSERLVFEQIRDFIMKYNTLPMHEALVIQTTKINAAKEDDVLAALNVLSYLETTKDEKIDEKWLTDETEKFCQEKALYNAAVETLSIMDDKTGEKPRGAIPQIFTDALGVSFNTRIGHDYIEDSKERFELYHRVSAKIPFKINYLNSITNGGVQTKTLNLIMGGVNVGKTLILCDFAADYLTQGHDVVYITLEMSENEIAKRIDANLLDTDLNELMGLTEDQYEKRVERVRSTTTGKLIIKEFPTAQASVVHFRAFLNELAMKRGFRPKILIIDYLGLCVSSRLKLGGSKGVGMFEHGKSVAEEMRGLMVEFDMCGWSAIQLNREGFKSSDPGMENSAESFGVPMTADFQIVVVNSDELEQLKQLMWKQVKNRYGDVTRNKRFVTGIDRNKQRIFNVDDQGYISDARQAPTKSVDLERIDKFNGWNFDNA